MDRHCAAKEATVARLQLVVDLVVNDDRFGFGGLGSVPVRFGAVELGR